MPRDIGASVIAELTASRIRPVLLVDVGFSGGTVYFWSGIGDLIIDGNTYVGAGNLLMVSPATETIEVKAQGAKLKLSGINSAVLSAVLGQVEQKQKVVCKLLFLSETDAPIGSTYSFFVGRFDTATIAQTGDTIEISITAESDLMILRRGRTRRYTREDQQTQYPQDNGFNMVTSLFQWDGRWGKPMNIYGERPTYTPPDNGDGPGDNDSSNA